MSDEQQGTPTPPNEPPKERAGYKDKQTSENTPMQDHKPDASEILSEVIDPKELEKGHLNIFLGSTKDSQLRARKLITEWLTINAATSQFLEGNIEEDVYNKAVLTWNKFVEETYPGKSSEDVKLLAQDTYQFINEVQDEVKIRSRLLYEEDVTNQTDRGNNYVTGDIAGKTPGVNTKGHKTSDKMRRTNTRASNEFLEYDVLLRDSKVSLTFTRPNRLTMGSVINDIMRTVGGYVRQINHNSVTIARIASMRAIWKHISKQITRSSVSDISDFGQLSQVITITDFNTLCIAYLDAYSNKGVQLRLNCLSEKCDWSAVNLIKPTRLHRHRPSLDTPEDLAIYGNLFNGQATYTLAETREMSRKHTYGLESNRVYVNEDKSIYVTIAPPTLEEAFKTFDYFIAQINPKLQEIAVKVLDEQEAATQRAVALNELASTEFIHWIQSYVVIAEPGSGEQDLVLVRAEEEDPAEFDKGLMMVITENAYFNTELARFILNKTPYMSKTFVGVRNYVCPKCKKNSGDLQDTVGVLDHNPGYTPIDPIMSFFTLAQLILVNQAVESSQVPREVLSD